MAKNVSFFESPLFQRSEQGREGMKTQKKWADTPVEAEARNRLLRFSVKVGANDASIFWMNLQYTWRLIVAKDELAVTMSGKDLFWRVPPTRSDIQGKPLGGCSADLEQKRCACRISYWGRFLWETIFGLIRWRFRSIPSPMRDRDGRNIFWSRWPLRAFHALQTQDRCQALASWSWDWELTWASAWAGGEPFAHVCSWLCQGEHSDSCARRERLDVRSSSEQGLPPSRQTCSESQPH